MPLDSRVLLSGQPLDVAAGVQQGAQAQQMQNAAQAQQNQLQQHQLQLWDDSVLKDYMSLPDTNMYTAAGLDKSLADLKGRVSPQQYMKLIDHTSKFKEDTVKYQTSLNKLNDSQIAQTEQVLDRISSNFKPLVDATTPEEFNAKRGELVASMSAETLNNGQPKFTPKQIADTAGYTREQVKQYWNVSSARKELIKNHKDEAAARLEEQRVAESKARQKMIEEGGVSGQKLAIVQDIQERVASGEITKEQGAVEMSAVSGTPRQSVLEVKAGMSKAALADPWGERTGSPGIMDAAIGKAVRGDPISFGPSSGLKEPTEQVAAKLANDPIISQIAAKTRRVDIPALAAITKQGDFIKIGESTVQDLLPALAPYLKTQNPTGIKLVNDVILKVQKAFGDADPIIAEQFITSLQADIARVQAGQTGAAATPVSFVKQAGIYVPTGLSEGNYKLVFDAVQREMKARTSSVDAKKAEIEGRMTHNYDLVRARAERLYPKPGSEATKIPADTQRDRDTDAYQIKMQEFEKTSQLVKDLESEASKATDPKIKEVTSAKIRRAKEDLVALRRELKLPEEERQMSKSGKPMIKRNGQWEYE